MNNLHICAMQLTKYAEREGYGVYARLERDAKVSNHTVLKAARDGLAVSYEIAEKLSAATGGECSIDEIRFPVDVGAKPPRKGVRPEEVDPERAA